MRNLLIAIFATVGILLVGILIVGQSKSNTSALDLAGITPIQKSTETQNNQAQQQQNVSLTFVPSPTDAISSDSAVIKTDKGIIELKLYPQDAPRTVTNFITLAKRGYYNNLTFHRVEDWVIQGGDPTGTGGGGTSIYGPTFEDELNPNTESYKEGYKEGILAMANRGPNTNGSQFFILTQDYPLDHNYTIFGKVTSGMDIVKQIKKGDKILGISVGE